MPYRVSEHGGPGRWDHPIPNRHLLGAWILALLLLAGALISFALDQMVTVSPDPVATYGSALKAEEAAEAQEREQRDAVD